ncbi:MAG: polysaccharide deacetylase family protein [Pseudomonadales bacterium]|jgi:peptidoglycan/xylan/chitin deacetylase (PgdA/CDA1 family)|nr:polysaccharide deacetylase family protein [Pseudomonadales bacterium]
MFTFLPRSLLLLLLLLCMAPAAFAAEALAPQAVILQYHHIASATPRATSVTPEEFRAHMDYLRDQGFSILPLPEVIAALRSGAPLPDKSAVLTFDDAYSSVYEAAYPLLKERQWPFTIFVPAALIGERPGLYSSWEQLREMGANGATLANHTLHHAYLLDRAPYADESAWHEAIKNELIETQARIAAQTGQDHELFAYPYGEYDPALQAVIRELGYTAFAQNSGAINANSDFSALPRFPFSGIYASLNSFRDKVNSLAFNVKTETASPLTSEQAPEVVLDFDGDYRFDALTCYHNNERMRITVVDAAAERYRLSSPTQSASRRFHYNCTAPGPGGRYYWYSVLWINPAIAE